MEKSEVLKARVSESLHRDFLEICMALGVTPATQLRRLIESFIAENREFTEDNVKILIEQPDDYMTGAYRVRMTLRERDAMQFKGMPVTFGLPRLPKRHVHADKGYAVATSNWDGRDSGLDGLFIDGVWHGHIYTNGVAEEDNPTPIVDVAAELKARVEDRIARFRGL